MLIEAEAIPYEPARLRGERLLVLAPHPDDEVIGCGGLVAQHLREGRRVRVIVVTDGAQQGEAEAREAECRHGVALLGNAEVEFLRFADRQLDERAAPLIREQLQTFRPDLILVPSPIEIHPDHLALSRLFCHLIQADPTLFSDLAVARVAFYEVGQPLRPNAIVDITDIAESKYAAIAEHHSQLARRDYIAYARGLNAYRAMTLPEGTKFAEAYHVVDLPMLRMTSFSELRRMTGSPPDIEITRQVLPLSVIVRTKDRPSLLPQAIDSIRATGYPCEIVVVNDGGTRPEIDGVTLVHHEQPRGRSEAANAGVRAASNAYVAFLDDDDLYYPEHLSTLANAASGTPQFSAWYTDAISAFLRPAENGTYETHTRLRLFSQDFDRDLLLADNYIPLPTMLVQRAAFLDAGAFDAAFDLFEDWDFLIRLSQRGDFLHVPRITVEVRHFERGTSVLLAAPEGSAQFREAKLQVWRKHAELLSNDVIANVLERQKGRLGALYSQVVETKGQVSDGFRNAERLEREKGDLIAQIGAITSSLNGYMLRVRELEGAIEAMTGIVGDYEHKTLQVERLSRDIEGSRRENDELRHANQETHQALELARVEAGRLRGLLDMIYRSRTWKLHTLVEKMRGR